MGHDFSWALGQLTCGHKVCRSGWNGKNQFLELQQPGGTTTLPFISIRTVQGDVVPWVASQTDLLAGDWSFAEKRQSVGPLTPGEASDE